METIKSYDWICDRWSKTLKYVVKKLETESMEFNMQSELTKIMYMLTGGTSLLTKDFMREMRVYKNEEH